MYKRIAVAIDGSKTSDMALDEAIKLSSGMNSTLLLLHVCEEMPIMWEPDDMITVQVEEMMKVIADSARALLEKYQKRVASQGIAVETRLVEFVGGRVGGIISGEAQKWNADLLVLGTHGRKGFEHLLMGSVAEGVIRSASMPVLLIRAKD
jgi:nucleotide-binding universal stress UspA family protein